MKLSLFGKIFIILTLRANLHYLKRKKYLNTRLFFIEREIEKKNSVQMDTQEPSSQDQHKTDMIDFNFILVSAVIEFDPQFDNFNDFSKFKNLIYDYLIE